MFIFAINNFMIFWLSSSPPQKAKKGIFVFVLSVLATTPSSFFWLQFERFLTKMFFCVKIRPTKVPGVREVFYHRYVLKKNQNCFHKNAKNSKNSLFWAMLSLDPGHFFIFLCVTKYTNCFFVNFRTKESSCWRESFAI